MKAVCVADSRNSSRNLVWVSTRITAPNRTGSGWRNTTRHFTRLRLLSINPYGSFVARAEVVTPSVWVWDEAKGSSVLMSSLPPELVGLVGRRVWIFLKTDEADFVFRCTVQDVAPVISWPVDPDSIIRFEHPPKRKEVKT